MKLKEVQVREFRSIWDSNPFKIDRVACLVGKNEAGKTAILQALYRLNPIVESDGNFDVIDDYPRSEVENYQHDIESKKRDHADVVSATFVLDRDEIALVEKEYGKDVLERPEVLISKGYGKGKEKTCIRTATLPVKESQLVKHLIQQFDIPADLKKQVRSIASLAELAQVLTAESEKQEQAVADAKAAAKEIQDEAGKAAALEKIKSVAESEQAKALRARLAELKKHGDLGLHIWNSLLRQGLPKFLYFDEYYQMVGHDNVEALKKRKDAGTLKSSDHPLLGLIELARLDLDKLLAPSRTQELKNKLQGASNHLSSQILKYWSQNKHLRMNFDVRQALPGDPDGMQNGTNIWGEVYDSKHLVSTGLGTRSAGFVWFFSFLAWYSSVKRDERPLVLLLDEPGLSLHGKAQEDLLRYFETEIVPNQNHQLIYTTHSPFMVDSKHFDRVRIVQDNGIDADAGLPRDQDGTKVFTEVLEAGPDSLFPLQGALGYEIYQTLFVGPNSLVVEGVSDLLYIQTISGVLESKGRTGLDKRWTITPVGGSDKVPTFVALMRSQKGLNIATLVDLQKSDQQMIENLYKKKLLKKSNVMTFADFTKTPEADIEDMFDEDLYLHLVNGEYVTKVASGDLTSQAPRIVVRLEEHFAKNPPKTGAFNHYRPARYMTERVSSLTIPDATLDRFEAAFKALNVLLE